MSLECNKTFSAEEAREFTDQIIRRMYARWDEKVFGGVFMRDLESGKLSLDTIRLFWQHWYSYPVEINNFHLISATRGFSRATVTCWRPMSARSAMSW